MTVDIMKATSHVTPADLEAAAELSSTETSLTLSQTSSAPPEDEIKSAAAKKKKKKRSKKPARNRIGDLHADDSSNCNAAACPPVLCISRNKHWKYISSYHGPWLQLPLELLESLLVLNLDPATVSGDVHLSGSPAAAPALAPIQTTRFSRLRERSGTISISPRSLYSHSPPGSPAGNRVSFTNPAGPYPNGIPLVQRADRAVPPPIDPGVFRSVAAIRRLIDEAAELTVRASSGLSAAALGSVRGGGGGGAMSLGGGSWSAANSLGLGGTLGDSGYGFGGGGRNAPMSATRLHRLRVLAVQKLADAYKADEIASSVMVMQRGTVFDDIAEKVLRIDPKNVDARYVHFFHEKIPSRQLAESTSTAVLDQLIAENSKNLEFYRTRGIVHCFRDEYNMATKDFTYALKESRALRRARQAHDPTSRSSCGENHPKAKRKKTKINGQAPANGTAAVIEGPDGEPMLLHPSVLPDAPLPLEPQLLFHRGAAHLAHAFFLIEETLFTLEGIPRIMPNDFGEVHLAYIAHGRYGGTEIGNPDGPLGASDGAKAHAYRAAFAESSLREQVCALLRKSKRDYEKFLAHFDMLDVVQDPDYTSDILQRLERAFLLTQTFRPQVHGPTRTTDTTTTDSEDAALSDIPLAFSTYHPLLLEAHFSVLLCLLLLGEFETLIHTFTRTAHTVAGLEGYPVFLPPRSMAQAEFGEVLERLAGGWKYGKMPDALMCVSEPLRRAPSPLFILSDEVHMAASSSSSSAGPSSSSSTLVSTSTGGTKTLAPSGRGSPASDDADADTDAGPAFVEPEVAAAAVTQVERHAALEHLRLLLAPVHARLRERAEAARAAAGREKKPAPLSLTLHGARVEVVLAWLGAVHLPELEAVANP